MGELEQPSSEIPRLLFIPEGAKPFNLYVRAKREGQPDELEIYDMNVYSDYLRDLSQDDRSAYSSLQLRWLEWVETQPDRAMFGVERRLKQKWYQKGGDVTLGDLYPYFQEAGRYVDAMRLLGLDSYVENYWSFFDRLFSGDGSEPSVEKRVVRFFEK